MLGDFNCVIQKKGRTAGKSINWPLKTIVDGLHFVDSHDLFFPNLSQHTLKNRKNEKIGSTRIDRIYTNNKKGIKRYFYKIYIPSDHVAVFIEVDLPTFKND